MFRILKTVALLRTIFFMYTKRARNSSSLSYDYLVIYFMELSHLKDSPIQLPHTTSSLYYSKLLQLKSPVSVQQKPKAKFSKELPIFQYKSHFQISRNGGMRKTWELSHLILIYIYYKYTTLYYITVSLVWLTLNILGESREKGTAGKLSVCPL